MYGTTISSTGSNSILKGEQVARLTKVKSKDIRTYGRGACFPRMVPGKEGLESHDRSGGLGQKLSGARE